MNDKDIERLFRLARARRAPRVTTKGLAAYRPLLEAEYATATKIPGIDVHVVAVSQTGYDEARRLASTGTWFIGRAASEAKTDDAP